MIPAAPLVLSIVAVAVLILSRDRFSLSFFYEVRYGVILAHRAVRVALAAVGSLHLPLRRFRVAVAGAVFLLAAILFTISLLATGVLATELRIHAV